MTLIKHLSYFLMLILLASCATTLPPNFAKKYYAKNEKTIVRIEILYNKLYKTKPIAVEFNDDVFNNISIEIKTDSIRYIYDFDLNGKKLGLTLLKFGYDTTSMMTLLKDMKSIKCTWINTLDYFVDDKKQTLTFISMRPKGFDAFFSNKKYYVLTFYKQPQYYDDQERLLDKRRLMRLRKVSNEVFWRINSRVCYTVMGHFR